MIDKELVAMFHKLAGQYPPRVAARILMAWLDEQLEALCGGDFT